MSGNGIYKTHYQQHMTAGKTMCLQQRIVATLGMFCQQNLTARDHFINNPVTETVLRNQVDLSTTHDCQAAWQDRKQFYQQHMKVRTHWQKTASFINKR